MCLTRSGGEARQTGLGGKSGVHRASEVLSAKDVAKSQKIVDEVVKTES